MTWIELEPHKAQLEDGKTYDAVIGQPTLLKNVQTQWGLKDKIVVPFLVKNGSNGPVSVNKRYTWSTNASGHFWKFLVKVVKGSIPTGMEIEDLEGSLCRVRIVHGYGEGGSTWDNVDKVMPAQ